MLKIRLTRRGKKNKVFFRIVVAEHTSPIKGRFLEVLGFLNPHTKEKNFKADRIEYWMEKGAQCSDSVHNLLVSDGILKGPKRMVKQKKKSVETKSEEAKAEVKPKDDQEEKRKEETKSEEKEVKKTEEAVKVENEKTSIEDPKPVEEAKVEEKNGEEKTGKNEEVKPEA